MRRTSEGLSGGGGGVGVGVGEGVRRECARVRIRVCLFMSRSAPVHLYVCIGCLYLIECAYMCVYLYAHACVRKLLPLSRLTGVHWKNLDMNIENREDHRAKGLCIWYVNAHCVHYHSCGKVSCETGLVPGALMSTEG